MRNKQEADLPRTTAGALTTFQENMPSTDLRGGVPEWVEEVDLRDYLEVLVRRKWLLFSVIGLVFLTTLVLTLATPKIFRAEASIEIIQEAAKVTKFEEVVSSDIQSREFYETQLKLLGSDMMARRVIDKLGLAENPVVVKAVFGDDTPGFFDKIKAQIRSLAVGDTEENQKLAAVAEEVIRQQKLLQHVKDNFATHTSRSGMLIGLSFTHTDRKIAQEVVNAYVDEFVAWKMDQRLESANLAKGLLMKQIERVKIDLEKAEEQLNAFAVQSGIVSLDSKRNSVYNQLEELNTALAQAESDFIDKEAVYQQAVIGGNKNLARVLNNEGIAKLKDEYARLDAQYRELSVTFHDEYPKVKALKTKMASVMERITEEEGQVFLSISNEYKAAHQKMETLKERVALQNDLALELNERATQYKIIQREVETNKQIFESLLERAKEIEAIVGISPININVVDRASLPIFPFKPKVLVNLLIALVTGTVCAIGLAFLLEYFTDNLSNPDEISDRFQIPILGVVPLARSDAGKLETAFASDPRAPISEALRTTKVSIQLSSTGDRSRSILISSTSPGEGKTTVAINLSLAFAFSGERVLLVDTDLRKPRVHKVFNEHRQSPGRGLSSLLAGILDSAIIFDSGFQNLHYVPAGPIPPNPVELLISDRFKVFMKTMTEKYDRVILDGPPHHGFADILVLSQTVGGVILVSSIGDTTRQALRHFKKGMLNVNGIVLGCIINKVNLTKRYGYRSYYNYYQSYNYSYGDGKNSKQITG